MGPSARRSVLLLAGLLMGTACGDSSSGALRGKFADGGGDDGGQSDGGGGQGGSGGRNTAGRGGADANGGAAPGAGGAIPTTCDSDRDCTALGKLCDFASGRCVSCLRAQDCQAGEECVAGECAIVVPCVNSLDCAGLVCDRVAGRCVECLGNADCAPGQLCTATRCTGGVGAGGTPGSGGAGTGGAGPGCGELAMHIVLDDTGSMVPIWVGVVDDLGAFLNAPESVGVYAGLQVMGPTCDPTQFVGPTAALAPLPQNATAITGSLPAFPLGAGAAELALRHAVAHAREFETQTGIQTVVVFVSDNPPPMTSATCVQSPESTVNAAAEGWAGTPRIPTYAIGLPTPGTTPEAAAFFEQLATAGGTFPPTVAVVLRDALAAIRDSLRCP